MSSKHPKEQNPNWIDQALRANCDDFAAWINKEPPLENARIRKLAKCAKLAPMLTQAT